jgi:alpha-D-xyloside xylohydrolase
VRGGRWLRERHGFDSVPLYLRPGAVVPLGAREDRPDTDHLAGLTLLVHPGPEPDWNRSVDIVGAHGRPVRFTVRRTAGAVVAGSELSDGWGVQQPGGPRVAASGGRAELS